jgi:hypothetical protein
MTKKEALATHLGWDISEIEYYQPATWSQKIIAVDNERYCATKTKTPPKVYSTTGISLTDWILAETFGNIQVWKLTQ